MGRLDVLARIHGITRKDGAAAAGSANAWHGSIGVGEIASLFASGRDFLAARALQNLFAALHPIRVVAVHREQHAAFADASFVALGLILWDSHTGQCADDAPKRSDGSRACK